SFTDAMTQSKLSHFTPTGRAPVFHYAVYSGEVNHEHPGGLGSLSGTDFVIKVITGGVRSGFAEEGRKFMHELGHNLGLDHGGGDDVNFKPNYISIMNYRFLSIGTLNPNGRQRYIDYSRRKLDTLDELSLDENVGINDPDGHLTTWFKFGNPNLPLN